MSLATDIRSSFAEALCYVICSRVEEPNQLFFLEKLPRQKFRCSKAALQEIERLEEISINKNPEPWFKVDDTSVKISSLNVYSLAKHFEDLKADFTLLKSSIICCVETWLHPETDPTDYTIENYTTYLNNAGRGKGIAIFSNSSFSHECDANGQNFQITKMTSADIDVICVYRSADGNKEEVIANLLEILTENKVTYICGDFNCCLYREPNNVISATLANFNLSQIVKKPTHKSGSLLDHGYLRLGKPFNEKFSIDNYCPYYSDHDGILLTLNKETAQSSYVDEKETTVFESPSDSPPSKKKRKSAARGKKANKADNETSVFEQPSDSPPSKRKRSTASRADSPTKHRKIDVQSDLVHKTKRQTRQVKPIKNKVNECIPCSTCSSRCSTCHVNVCDMCSPDAEELMSRRHCKNCFDKLH